MIPGNHFFIDSRSSLVINAIHEALRSQDSTASLLLNPSR